MAKWIQKAIRKPGALRRSLGVKKGETIPSKTLAKAAKKSGVTGRRARLAKTLGKFSKPRRSASNADGPVNVEPM